METTGYSAPRSFVSNKFSFPYVFGFIEEAEMHHIGVIQDTTAVVVVVVFG